MKRNKNIKKRNKKKHNENRTINTSSKTLLLNSTSYFCFENLESMIEALDSQKDNLTHNVYGFGIGDEAVRNFYGIGLGKNIGDKIFVLYFFRRCENMLIVFE